jgi:hypothetical protein
MLSVMASPQDMHAQIQQPVKQGKLDVYKLDNGVVTCTVVFRDGKLFSDTLALGKDYRDRHGSQAPALFTDAGFALEVILTGCTAPGKVEAGDNEIALDKHHFILAGHEDRKLRTEFYLHGTDNPFIIRLTYSADTGAWFIWRSLSVKDTSGGRHFLHQVKALDARLADAKSTAGIKVIKGGGFGQPVGILNGRGGAFFGLEQPTSENKTNFVGNIVKVTCSDYIGEIITGEWLETGQVVAGITPDEHIRKWFMNYLDYIRTSPPKPQLVYHSLYDLPGPEEAGSNPEKLIDENHINRVMRIFGENLQKPYGIFPGVFILDDGWDDGTGEWVVDSKRFPNGLSKLSSMLKVRGSSLGARIITSGVMSGGDRRLSWWRDKGYETVDDWLCPGGEKSLTLLHKRLADLGKTEGIDRLNLDGLLFSCSESGHGHPIGIYSRKALADKVAGLCTENANDHTFPRLSLEKGAWLSPWWIRYTEGIRIHATAMGTTPVPSISSWDVGTTYTDDVLYQHIRQRDSWYPLTDLLIPGISEAFRGTGLEDESPEMFGNAVLFSIARGAASWELYLSPGSLTSEQWEILGRAAAWGMDRYPLLSQTIMVGGKPSGREIYGYLHFKDEKGIVALRNPFIQPRVVSIKLEPMLGLDPLADSLVVERIYPDRHVDPRLYKTGDDVVFSLDGYESSVYEIYPVREAGEPLVSSIHYDLTKTGDSTCEITYSYYLKEPVILNPSLIASVVKGDSVLPGMLFPPNEDGPIKVVDSLKLQYFDASDTPYIEAGLDLIGTSMNSRLVVLLEFDTAFVMDGLPDVTIRQGNELKKTNMLLQKPYYLMCLTDLVPGRNNLRIYTGRKNQWAGKLSLWVVCRYTRKTHIVSVRLTEELVQKILPKSVRKAGDDYWTQKLGEIQVK